MKILLINSNTKLTAWPVPPLGLCYIATHAQKAGHEVRFLDLIFSLNIKKDVTSHINDFNPEIIGISIRNIDNNSMHQSAFYIPKIKEEIVDICKAHSNGRIIIGGAAVGINAEELLEYFNIEYAIQGEGEEAFLNYLGAMESGGDLSQIKGLVYRTNGITKNNGFNRTENIDSLSFPNAYKWFDFSRYETLNGSIGIQTKRGCGLHCTYCAYKSIEGGVYRLRSAKKVADEIEEIINACNPSIIEFVDSLFNIPLKHSLSICDEIIRRKIKGNFRASISPASISAELFEKMKKANFTEIDMNAESASMTTLLSLGKTYNVDAVVRAAELIKKFDIPTIWFFLFGGVGESKETIMENFNFIDHYVQKNHLCVIASGIRINSKTDLMKTAKNEGLISDTQNLLFPLFYESKSLPKERLLTLVKQEAAKRPNCIYLKENSYRPNWLIKSVKRISKMINLKKPIWQYEIYLSRLSHMLGSRKSGLA
jgi:radical SAM superfamily enzyme YgiQ (UPF0313 family)